MSLYRSVPRRNIEGQVSLAKWPTSTPSRSPAWDVDDSTAQTVSKLNSYFGFRPSTRYAKSGLASPAYSPELPHLYSDGTPELRHDTPSDARTRTSSFGPETPPTRFDPSFQSEPHPPTPARHGHSHLRSYSDGCSLHGYRSDHGAAPESADYDHQPHSHAAMMPRAGSSPSHQAPAQEPLSPHHRYTVNLTRNNQIVTLCLTSGESSNPANPAITCYRQTYLPIGDQYGEFFKASDALIILQLMVNPPSQPFVPLTGRECRELMNCMRNSNESMILLRDEPHFNPDAWKTFFSAELAAGRVWDDTTIIYPWAVLQKLMNALNSEWRKRKHDEAKIKSQPYPDKDEPLRTMGLLFYGYSLAPSARAFGLSLSESSTPPDVIVDHHSAPSASPPPRTPTEPNPPARIQFMRAKSPPSSSSSASPIRRRRQNSEPVRRLSLSPPRIALLKSNPCRQSLRRLHAASTPSRLVFYDSIRTWPTSSHRSRVRLPPCSKFLELTADRGTDARNPIML